MILRAVLTVRNLKIIKLEKVSRNRFYKVLPSKAIKSANRNIYSRFKRFFCPFYALFSNGKHFFFLITKSYLVLGCGGGKNKLKGLKGFLRG